MYVYMCDQIDSQFIENQLFDLASDIPALNESARLWFLGQGSNAVDILINALEDSRFGSVGHWRMLLLLRSFAEEKALPTVLRVLRDDDPITRPAAMEVLAAIKTLPAVDALIELLSHANSDVVKYASVLLGQTGNKRAIIPLSLLLNSSAPSIRYSAIKGLLGLNNSEARLVLINHLVKETDPENRVLIRPIP
jgi:hypothetical protein